MFSVFYSCERRRNVSNKKKKGERKNEEKWLHVLMPRR